MFRLMHRRWLYAITVSVTLSLPSISLGDFVRGDSSGDGNINIADSIGTLNYLIGGPPPICLDAADVNDDGSVNIADGVYSLHFLFQPGANPPPAPFPGCGPDPTADALDCVSFPLCP